MQRQTAQINGHRMVYYTAGNPDHPPIIMVHGWMSYHRVWESTVPVLQDTHYCIAVDLLGHGESDKPKDADYNIPAQAERIVALANALELDQFALIGHSMGGQIVTYIAACMAPQRVTQLIPVSPVITGELSNHARFRHWLFDIGRFVPLSFPVIGWLRRAAPFAYLLYGHVWFYNMFALPRDVWLHQSDWVFDPNGIVPIFKAGHGIHAANLTGDLVNVTASTLVIYGKQDATLPYTDGILAAEKIPDARLLLFETECGHFPMFEQQDTYQQNLSEFIL